jgi:hypothetical protein
MSESEPKSPSSGGRTLKVAAEARRNGQEEIVKPSELIELWSPKGKHLSLSARKTWNLMLQAAAGDAWRPGFHKISKKVLRGSHDSNDRFNDVLSELTSKSLSMRDIVEGETGLSGMPLLAEWFIPDDDSGYVRFQFNEKVRKLMAASETYAALQRQTVLAFRSRYALALYEIGAQLAGRRDPTKIYEVDDLRKVLGVPPKAMARWQDFRRYALETAVAEINQLAHFEMRYEAMKRGRAMSSIQIEAWKKDPGAVIGAVEERDRHSVGRKARREGVVEKVEAAPASLPSPSSSSPPTKQRLRPARGLATIAPLPGVDHEQLKAWVKSSKSVIEALTTIEAARKAEAEEPGAAARMMSAAFTEN